jgi:hypothetical protein
LLHLFNIAIGAAAMGNTHYPFRPFEIIFRTVPVAFAMLPVLIIPNFLTVAAHRQKFFIQSYFFLQFLLREASSTSSNDFLFMDTLP